MKRVAVLALVVGGFTVGAVASAAVGWRVFASSTDSGNFATYASASANALHPAGLAVRASGTAAPFDVSWTLFCQGERAAGAGEVVQVSVAAAEKCLLTGSAFGKAGRLRLDLLRR